MSTAHVIGLSAEKDLVSRWRLAIRQNPVLFGLQDSEIDRVLQCSVEAKYEPGEQIFGKGDVTDALFLIGEGLVEVCPTGSCESDVASLILGRPEIFGELGLVEEGRRPVTVRAASRCTLLRISRQEFRRMLEDNHHLEIEFRILLQMSERLRHVDENALAARSEVPVSEVPVAKREETEDRFRILDERITNETKIFEASLKLSQALFDQTKIRTDEVISDAERNRARMSNSLTLFVGIAGLAVTLFGFLGLKELADIRNTAHEIDETDREVEAKASDLRKSLTEIDNNVTTTKKQVEEASQINTALQSIRATVVAEVLVPLLTTAITDRDQSLSKMETIYNALSQISPETDRANSFLDPLEGNLLKDSGMALRDYTPFLGVVASNASRDSKVNLRAQYLMLANMILLDPPPGGRFRNEQTFGEALTSFCQFSHDYNGEPLTDIERFDLRKLFAQKTTPRRKKFQQVEDCVPHGLSKVESIVP